MDNTKAKEILERYLSGTCTPDEKQLVESWYNLASSQSYQHPIPPDYERVRRRLTGKLPHVVSPAPSRRWLPYAAAVLLMIAFTTGLYFHFNAHKIVYASDVPPGGNHAVLTLSNGKEIILSSAGIGTVAKQGNVTANKTSNGILAYVTQKNKTLGPPVFNTISTPQGGQFSLVLADGTKVQLNAASSLTFPVEFSGDLREVQLTGEGYFEVTHRKAQPFMVSFAHQKVQVLGTKFNITAYKDELITSTTLIQGSVRLLTKKTEAILHPGDQVDMNQLTDQLFTRRANLEQVTAWKNGDFIFKDESLSSIMRKLSRWYNVEVVYNSADKQNILFGGLVSRSKNISSVLKMIEQTGKVQFRLEGRRITVM